MAENEESNGTDHTEGAPQGNQGGNQNQVAGGQQHQGGGQPQRAPPQQYNTGPSIGDIFSIKETKDEIKYGIVVYALVGLGAGIGLLGITTGMGGSAAGFGQALSFMGAIIAVPIAVSIALAAFIGLRQNDELEDQPDTFAYATAGVTALGGTAVAYLVTVILAMLGAGGLSFDGMILPLVMTAVGAAIVAAGIIWADRSLLAPTPVPRQPRGHPQQQPPQQPPE